MTLVISINVENQPPFFDPQRHTIGTGIIVRMLAQWLEQIPLDQIEDRNSPFLLDIGVPPDDRPLIEVYMNYARVGHRQSHIEARPA